MSSAKQSGLEALSPREQVLRNIRGALASGAGPKTSPKTDSAAQRARTDSHPQPGESGFSTDLAVPLEAYPVAVQQHLAAKRRHTLPALSGDEDLTERLLQQMTAVQISITRLQTVAEVPAAVEEYQREQAIDGGLVVSPAIQHLDWPEHARSCSAREALQPEQVLTSVTPCLCAVAETGSIVTLTDVQTPTTLNYLPDNHVVLLHEDQIVAYLEDAWARQRASMSAVPRALNFLTGPSRTADIEQTIELGAHGPRRMHVLLVAERSNKTESQ